MLGEREAAACVSVRDRLRGDILEFTGRAQLLQQATDLVHPTAAGMAMTSAFAGVAGVGKTTLAVHLSHRILARGGDRTVLFANLRGFDPAGPPADPFAVLESFLRLLGVSGETILKT
ncbi:ATP-binding protein [Amycolatopsis balhimycina]|uniref:ATP-binding protein n=1 Tax=Amycolatopsis balhimycina TaxID=208443 RepID=UPI000F782D28|nr:ATP-binding protein [Amycolatopsis balhimycina]